MFGSKILNSRFRPKTSFPLSAPRPRQLARGSPVWLDRNANGASFTPAAPGAAMTISSPASTLSIRAGKPFRAFSRGIVVAHQLCQNSVYLNGAMIRTPRTSETHFGKLKIGEGNPETTSVTSGSPRQQKPPRRSRIALRFVIPLRNAGGKAMFSLSSFGRTAPPRRSSRA
jgi:hypothetical protein